MYKLSITIVFLLFSILLSSQEIPSTRAVVIQDSIGNASIEILIQATEIQKNIESHYFSFFKNKIYTTQSDYIGKLLHGSYTAFYPDDSLREKGYFKNGLKEGKWSKWNKTGNLDSVEHWKGGDQTGTFMEFQNDGHIKRSGTYHKGTLHGKIKEYQNGELTETLKYKHGKQMENKKKLLKKDGDSDQ